MRNFKLSRFLYTLFLLVPLFGAGNVQAQGIGSFIVGGQVVGSADRYPFMVSLQIDSNNTNNFVHACGGTLISEQWVLTAAHCVTNSDFNRPVSTDNVGLLLGTNSLDSTEGTFVIAENIIVHPGYSIQTQANDIALVQLPAPFPAPIAALPVTGSAIPVVDEITTAIGWGAVFEGGRSSSRLREVGLPVVSNASCYPVYPIIFDSRLALCAGGSPNRPEDSCTGDSGGPLLSFRDNIPVVAGIISLGIGCGRAFLPGVYTRVTAYTDWITGIVGGTIGFADIAPGQQLDNTPITRLPVDASTSGSVGLRGVAYFDVSGANTVDVISNTGDVDLYIIEDPDFQDISIDLIHCRSEFGSPLDSCPVHELGNGAYAIVFGFSDSQYTIATSSRITTRSQSVSSSVFADSVVNASNSNGGGGGAALPLSLFVLLCFAIRRRKY